MKDAAPEVTMPAVQTPADVERGRMLREARTAKGLSQRRVAQLADIPQPYVSFYELADPRYPLTDERYQRLLRTIEQASPPPPDRRQKVVLCQSARIHLPPDIARDWANLDIERRSEIVEAGYEALGYA